jgi:hypothetical protein
MLPDDDATPEHSMNRTGEQKALKGTGEKFIPDDTDTGILLPRDFDNRNATK